MDCMNIIESIVGSFFEIASILSLLKVFREESQRNNNILAYAFCAVTALYIAIVNYYGLGRFLLLFSYGAIVVYAVGFYHFPLKRGIFLVCTSIILVGLIELLVYAPVSLLQKLQVPDTVILLIAVTATFAVSSMIPKYNLFLRLREGMSDEDLKGYYYSILACFVVIVTVMYFQKNGEMSFLEGLYLFTAVGIIMVSAYKISVYRRELKLQKEYSQVYGEVVREIRERQHKFTNQLNAVYSLCYLYDSYEELVQKLKEESGVLQNYVMPAKLLVLEEPVVVAHVYQKMCEALDRGICLEMELSSGVKELGIPEIYLVEVIGNLLDNAMDEVDRRGLGETVYLEIHPEGESVCICVSNEHEKIPHAVYKEFFKRGYSGKGAGRGEGLAYVKKIVHRYRGELEVGNVMRKEKNCFYIKILFPVKKSK